MAPARSGSNLKEKMPHDCTSNDTSNSGSDGGEQRNTSRSISFEKWILTLLAGQKNSNMISAYLDSAFFQQTRNSVLTRTGIDLQYIQRILPIGAAIQTWGPKTLDLLKHHATSSVTIDKRRSHKIGQDVLKWLDKQQTVKASQPRLKFHGQHDILADSKGAYSNNSSQFFWFEGVLCSAEATGSFAGDSHMYNSSVALTPKPKEDANPPKIILRCMGWSNQPLRRLIGQCSVLKNDQLEFFELTSRNRTVTYWPKRPLDTIDMEPERLAEIKKDVQEFFDKDTKLFYSNAGTGHRRGLLFFGPPGTGKTSLSVAIASEAEKPLYQIRLSGMSDEDLFDAFRALPKDGCVVLMEDIDSAGVNREQMSEEKRGKEKEKEKDADEYEEDGYGFELDFGTFMGGPPRRSRPPPRSAQPRSRVVTLSGLLNAIDGAGAAEGRLLIMTTNAPGSLDKALYRPGRIDKMIYLEYSNKVTAACTFRRMFARDPRNKYEPETIDRWAKLFAAQVPSNTFTPAELANYCVGYRGQPKKAIEKFREFLQARREGKDAFQYDINGRKPEAGHDEEIPDQFDWEKDEDLEEGNGHSTPSEKTSPSESSPKSSVEQDTVISSFDPEEEVEALVQIFQSKYTSTVQDVPTPMVTAPTSPVLFNRPCLEWTDSQESRWTEAHHHQASSEPLCRGPVRLRPVSPRPEELVQLNQEEGLEENREVLEVHHPEASEGDSEQQKAPTARIFRWGFPNPLGGLFCESECPGDRDSNDEQQGESYEPEELADDIRRMNFHGW